MKKEKNKIKLTKTKKILLSVLTVLIFIVLIICLSTADKPKEFEWSDIVLNQMLPKPSITKGKINDNSEEYLSLDLYKISAKDYEDYVNKCLAKGFNIETEKENRSFNSYNKNGYKLELYYLLDEEKLDLSLEAPMQFKNIKWSQSEIAKLLPVPTFEKGKTVTDNDGEYSVYLSNISKEKYEKYIDECINNGFNLDSDKDDKSFSSKNKDDYSLSIDYVGNGVIYVSIKEPEYETEINVNYKSELFDANYSVDVYADDELLGTVSNSNNETFEVTLKRGTHEFEFENADDSSVSEKVKINVMKKQKIAFEITTEKEAIKVKVTNGEEIIEVKSIKLDINDDIKFDYYNDSPQAIDFEVETNSQKEDINYSDLFDFVSENEKVAKVEFKEGFSSNEIVVTPVSDGETSVYIKSKDGKVLSKKIKVTVDLNDESELSDYEDEETTKSGRTVYVTPYGKKYHYSKSCAGKNAMEIDEQSAKNTYDPCQKCAG